MTEILKQGEITAKTNLANAQVEKLKQETASEAGLDYSGKMAVKAYGNYLTGATYADLAQNLDPVELRVHTNRVRMGLGLLGQPPAGINEDVWLAMDEADQALFD